MVKVELIESDSYSRKLVMFYILILLDVVGNSYSYFTELGTPGSIKYTSTGDLYFALAIFGIQIFLLVMTTCWVFYLICRTFLFRFGLLGILCREFKLLFSSIPVNILLFLAEKGLRYYLLVAVEDTISIWDNPAYVIVFWVRSVFMVYYYLLLVETSFDLGDPQYYKPHKWLAM